jgi:serine/threonine protein kinase
MRYLHQMHILHQDLKLKNVLLKSSLDDWRGFSAKVSDFGLSKKKQQTYVTGVTSLRGTLPWIAPEIIKSPKAVTEQVDVYSFGVVLWELWTLREPFEGINYHALLHMISTSEHGVRPVMPGSSEWEGEVPSEPAVGWVQLMQESWSEDPARRPPFNKVVPRLEEMLKQLMQAKRRQAGSSRQGSNGSQQFSGSGSL